MKSLAIFWAMGCFFVNNIEHKVLRLFYQDMKLQIEGMVQDI